MAARRTARSPSRHRSRTGLRRHRAVQRQPGRNPFQPGSRPLGAGDVPQRDEEGEKDWRNGGIDVFCEYKI